MLLRNVLFAAIAAAAVALPVQAQVPDTIATAEFLDGWRGEDGRHMTALKISLAPGWKTYWRAPGDAGIPPRFDWSRSENAERISISYPLPTVFEVAGMRSIGYDDEVIFPISISPKDTGAPIELSADMIIGVCEEVCVPLELSVSAMLPATASLNNPVVSRAMADRPMSRNEAGVGAVTCRADYIEDGLRVVANIEMPQLGPEEIAVIEYDDPEIWISEPKLMRKGNQIEAHVDLVPIASAPFAYFRDQTRITIFGGGKAVEINGCS